MFSRASDKSKHGLFCQDLTYLEIISAGKVKYANLQIFVSLLNFQISGNGTFNFC
jgi:hypothetical protein